MHGEYKPPGGKLVAADVEVAGGRLAGSRSAETSSSSPTTPSIASTPP